MAAADGSGEIDLSGAWNGLYNLPRISEPVFFDAVLAESECWLSGTITEAVLLAGRRQVLESHLQGRRTGRLVTWLKIYDGSVAAYDTVHYDGGINGDATEIEGRWNIPSNWSGTFLMIRAGGRQAVRARGIFQDA